MIRRHQIQQQLKKNIPRLRYVGMSADIIPMILLISVIYSNSRSLAINSGALFRFPMNFIEPQNNEKFKTNHRRVIDGNPRGQFHPGFGLLHRFYSYGL